MQSLLKRKELMYMIFRRYPREMQENLDNGSFMEISKPWRKAVEYYWKRRYHNSIKGQSTVAHRNYVTKFGKAIKCIECTRPFSDGTVTPCWRCRKYTCWDCCKPSTAAIYYCSCNQHQKKCKKCGNPFIPYSTNDFEIYCFPCQHKTGMYDEMWKTVSRDSQLPYGTFEMRRTFREYMQNLPGRDERNDLYGGGIAIGNHAVAIGAAVAGGGFAVGGQILVGGPAAGNNNNNQDHNWADDYEYYSDDGFGE